MSTRKTAAKGKSKPSKRTQAKTTKTRKAPPPVPTLPVPEQIRETLSEEGTAAYAELNERERAFVHAYVQKRSAEAAAREAGYENSYCRSYAARLLRRPSIAMVVAEIDRLAFEALGITDEKIIERYWLEARTAEEGGTRLGALDRLAKIRRMFPDPKLKIDGGNEALAALDAALDAIDGAGTMLPSTTEAGDHVRH